MFKMFVVLDTLISHDLGESEERTCGGLIGGHFVGRLHVDGGKLRTAKPPHVSHDCHTSPGIPNSDLGKT